MFGKKKKEKEVKEDAVSLESSAANETAAETVETESSATESEAAEAVATENEAEAAAATENESNSKNNKEKNGNPYVERTCTKCNVAFQENDDVIVCAKCGGMYHKQCWDDNNGCVTENCKGKISKKRSYIASSGNQKPAKNEEKALIAESPKNPYSGQICSHCNVAFGDTDEVTVCSKCGTALHKQCWSDHGGCTTPGCDGSPESAAMIYPDIPKPKKKKSKIYHILMIYGGLLIAACITVAILFWLKILCIHEWQPATCTQPEICAKCDKERNVPLGHDWLDATCTEPQTCSRCGAAEGQALGHEWVDADCLNPKTCERCGETVGDPLGHDWKNADCTHPKTCKRCGEETGSPLGHNWRAATCTKPKTCKRCNKTTGTAKGHSWKPATLTAPKTCSVCGKTEGSALNYSYIGEYTVEVDEDSTLLLRDRMSLDSSTVASIPNNTKIDIWDCGSSDYYYAEYNGKYGYVRSAYVVREKVYNGNFKEGYFGNIGIYVQPISIKNDGGYVTVEVLVRNAYSSSTDFYLESNVGPGASKSNFINGSTGGYYLGSASGILSGYESRYVTFSTYIDSSFDPNKYKNLAVYTSNYGYFWWQSN